MVGPLMESELFGHVKGAFTGAATAKIGLIEAANGGTALFDEIGELPLDLQAKLLRVLQEKEFRPVGSVTTRRSDFRIIAATNRDLAKEVEKGTFRRDLYFRLNVINIQTAPLRERKEDIPALINHFLGRVGGNYTLTAEAMEVMLSYDWPGNVRELENCIQHMVAINSGPLLHVADLPSSLQNFIAQKKSQYLMAAATANPLLDVRSYGARDRSRCSGLRAAECSVRDPAGGAGAACHSERARIYQGRSCGCGPSSGNRTDHALPKAKRIQFGELILREKRRAQATTY